MSVKRLRDSYVWWKNFDIKNKAKKCPGDLNTHHQQKSAIFQSIIYWNGTVHASIYTVGRKQLQNLSYQS